MKTRTDQAPDPPRGFDPFRPASARARWIVWVAALCSLLAHVLFWLVLPAELLPKKEGQSQWDPESFDLLLEPLPDEDTSPEPLRYVEANPDVPENQPDETDQFSFRDQQAADESDLAVVDEQPDTGGEMDSQTIMENRLSMETGPLQAEVIGPDVPMDADDSAEVEAELAEDDLASEATDGMDENEQTEVAFPAPLPRSDAFPFEDEEVAGEGVRLELGDLQFDGQVSDVDLHDDGPIPITRPMDGEDPQFVTEGGGGEARAAARPSPRPRPRLAPDLVEAPIRESVGAASRRGELAIDATFSEFGEYQQQMIAAVQRGWFQEIDFFQPLDTGAYVHLRFVLQADGVVRDMEVIETTAGEVATFICVAAIEKRSPFRSWTREMVDIFGEEQTMNFRFFYR